jgi:hypothetical protein
MKGIYLTEECKKDIKNQILEYESFLRKSKVIGVEYLKTKYYIEFLKSLIISATILPVEESWDDVFSKTFSQAFITQDYPNGVIIQPNV